jgi:hypothetical protein
MKVKHIMSNGEKRKSIAGMKVPADKHTHSVYIVVAKAIKDKMHKACNVG